MCGMFLVTGIVLTRLCWFAMLIRYLFFLRMLTDRSAICLAALFIFVWWTCWFLVVRALLMLVSLFLISVTI